MPVLRVWVHLCCFLLSYCTPVQLWGQPCLCNLTEGPLTLDAIVLSDLWFLSLHLGSRPSGYCYVSHRGLPLQKCHPGPGLNPLVCCLPLANDRTRFQSLAFGVPPQPAVALFPHPTVSIVSRYSPGSALTKILFGPLQGVPPCFCQTSEHLFLGSCCPSCSVQLPSLACSRCPSGTSASPRAAPHSPCIWAVLPCEGRHPGLERTCGLQAWVSCSSLLSF